MTRTSARPRSRNKSRSRYHHGALRDALVVAATEMVEQGGERAVNMREAARIAGVSSGAPFRHFENKHALLEAVAEAGGRRLAQAMSSAQSQAPTDDPVEVFRAGGVAYVEWAAANRNLFRLIHSNEPGFAAVGFLREQQRTELESLLESGAAASGAKLALLAGHALVYGLGRLIVDGLLSDDATSPEQARALAEAVTGVLGQGLDFARFPPAEARRR